jgi:hypothetical protein
MAEIIRVDACRDVHGLPGLAGLGLAAISITPVEWLASRAQQRHQVMRMGVRK